MVRGWIVIIGDEILSGGVQDTNSYHLAKKLSETGIGIERIIALPDDPEAIRETFKKGLKEVEVIISSGGLGPTPDDWTKNVAAGIFKTPFVMNKTFLKRIEKRFISRGKEVPELAKDQALVPKNAIIFDNSPGMTPGLCFRKNSHYLILLPGVPQELRTVLEKKVVPFLKEHYKLKEKFSVIIRTTGIAETEIFHKIEELAKGIRIAYLPHPSGVDVKIIAKSRRLLSKAKRSIVRRIKPYVYGYGEEKIEEVVGRLLRRKGLTLATAESCTGGLLGDMITSVPKSSDYFIGGVVAYSNKIKEVMCGVKRETLKKFGAVSRETVEEMAKGIRKGFKTNIGVSISGIAGPGGGTKEKPVGLVYIGISYKRKTEGIKYRFYGTREMVKKQAAVAALYLIRKEIRD